MMLALGGFGTLLSMAGMMLVQSLIQTFMQSGQMREQAKFTGKEAKKTREFQAGLQQKKEKASKQAIAAQKKERGELLRSTKRAKGEEISRQAFTQLSAALAQAVDQGFGGMLGAPQGAPQGAAAPQAAAGIGTGGGLEGVIGDFGGGQGISPDMAALGGPDVGGPGSFEALMQSIPSEMYSNPLLQMRAEGVDLPPEGLV